jgi:hypothetical protein
MKRVSCLVLLVALPVVVAVFGGCGDDAILLGLPMGGTGGQGATGGGGRGGSGGSGALGGVGGAGTGGGRGGTSGNAGSGAGGSAGTAGVAGTTGGDAGAAPDASVAPEPECTVDSECDEGNPCTVDTCTVAGTCSRANAAANVPCGSSAVTECTLADGCDGAGACRPNHVAAGTACGSTNNDACTDPDLCDGAGSCNPNNATDGTVCALGRCTAGACDCASLRVTTVPFTGNWDTSTGAVDFFSGSCAGAGGGPDYVVVFTAPAAGSYTFRAAATTSTDDLDSTLTLVSGACGTTQRDTDTDEGCNDDEVQGVILDSELAGISLSAGEVISVVVSVFQDAGGPRDTGGGTLSITLDP